MNHGWTIQVSPTPSSTPVPAATRATLHRISGSNPRLYPPFHDAHVRVADLCKLLRRLGRASARTAHQKHWPLPVNPTCLLHEGRQRDKPCSGNPFRLVLRELTNIHHLAIATACQQRS
jgi:hypothetical protein